jgi:hypothetical protein
MQTSCFANIKPHIESTGQNIFFGTLLRAVTYIHMGLPDESASSPTEQKAL